MAFFTGWFSRGIQFVSRVGSGIAELVISALAIVRGQPVSRGGTLPTPPGGVVDVPADIRQVLLETGKAETPAGVISIVESELPKTIAGAIPQAWMDELDWKSPLLTGKPSIFGEPYHYQIEFKILVKDVDQTGKGFLRTETQYYTVTSDTELDRASAIARGLELAEIDYNTDDPYFGGTVVGIGEVQPVVYVA